MAGFLTGLPATAASSYIRPRMLAVETTPGPVGSRRAALLRLGNREFLNFREFLRRYEQMPLRRKAELTGEMASGSTPIDPPNKRRAYSATTCANTSSGWWNKHARSAFCLEDDEYRSQTPDADGVLHSRVFPGLRLPVAPLLAGDIAQIL